MQSQKKMDCMHAAETWLNPQFSVTFEARARQKVMPEEPSSLVLLV